MLKLLHVKNVLYLRGEAVTGPTRTDLEMLRVDYITILSGREQRRLFIVTNMVTNNLFNMLNSGKCSFKSVRLPELRVTKCPLIHLCFD
jgi:hypothetical protein